MTTHFGCENECMYDPKLSRILELYFSEDILYISRFVLLFSNFHCWQNYRVTKKPYQWSRLLQTHPTKSTRWWFQFKRKSPLPGKKFQFDSYFFQMGLFNHQPVWLDFHHQKPQGHLCSQAIYLELKEKLRQHGLLTSSAHLVLSYSGGVDSNFPRDELMD